MSSNPFSAAAALEALLTRIYVDESARERFLADPAAEARRAGLAEADGRALAANLDRVGLRLAASSFSAKRRQQAVHPPARRLWATLFKFFGRKRP